MPSRLHLDLGHGPVVVLLHGVGIGPRSFAALADLLADDHRVLVVERARREGGRALPLLDELGGQLVGVSGGATLGLVAAIHRPRLFGGLVLHEPLVGSWEPTLHTRFLASAARAAEGPAETMDVVRAVMGERTWEAVGPDGRAWAIAASRLWQGEIAEFADFDPTAGELAGLAATPLLVTVGGRSPDERHRAAAVLARTAGARTGVVPDAGNVAHVDAPVAFADLVRTAPPPLARPAVPAAEVVP